MPSNELGSQNSGVCPSFMNRLPLFSVHDLRANPRPLRPSVGNSSLCTLFVLVSTRPLRRSGTIVSRPSSYSHWRRFPPCSSRDPYAATLHVSHFVLLCVPFQQGTLLPRYPCPLRCPPQSLILLSHPKEHPFDPIGPLGLRRPPRHPVRFFDASLAATFESSPPPFVSSVLCYFATAEVSG